MAFHKILVALDRSKTGEDVFNQALELARQKKSELCLVSYLEWTPRTHSRAVNDFSSMPKLDMAVLDRGTLQIELERVQQTLAEYQAVAKEAGVKAVVQCDIADPSATICKKARDWNVDLVMMGRRERAGLSELMMGSISNYVLHNAPCSVLVIQ